MLSKLKKIEYIYDLTKEGLGLIVMIVVIGTCIRHWAEARQDTEHRKRIFILDLLEHIVRPITEHPLLMEKTYG